MKKILFALLAATMLIGCQEKKDDNVIRIGAILPLTGEISAYGIGCKNGIDIALDSINKDKQNIIVDFYDDKGITKESILALNIAHMKGSRIIVGPITSASAMALIENSQETFIFSPTASSPELLNKSKLFLRNWSSDALEAKAMAKYVRDKDIWSRIGVIYVNNDYGLALYSAFQQEILDDCSIIGCAIEPNKKNYRDQITKVLNANVDVIYIIGYHNDLTPLTRQIKQADTKIPILSSSNFETAELFDSLGDLANGVIYCTCEIPQTSQLYTSFENRYIARYNKLPDVFAKNSYDIIMLIWAALSNNSSNSIIDAVKYIKSMTHYGVSGEMKFLDSGDVVKPVAIKCMVDSRIEIIDIIDYE